MPLQFVPSKKLLAKKILIGEIVRRWYIGAHVASDCDCVGVGRHECSFYPGRSVIDHTAGYRDEKTRPTGRASLVGGSPLWGVLGVAVPCV